MSLDRDELGDLLGAFAIDALDDATHRRVEESLPAHPDLMADVDRMRSTVAPLGRLTTAPPAEGLADRLMAGALGARAAGRPVGDTVDATLVETYRSARDNLLTVLADLPDAAGSGTTIYGSDVTNLVAHLAAVEHLVGDRLGLWSTDVDPARRHVGVGGPAHGATLTAAVELFEQRSAAVVDRIGELADDELAARVAVHGIEFDVREMLTIRAFEVWSHTEDVCRTLGRAEPPVASPVIRAMSIQAIDLLTFFMSKSPQHRDKTLRITLTGPGGGSWVERLDRGSGGVDQSVAADATLVADALDFCRLFADRLDAETAVAQGLGDEALVRELMAIAPTFADYGERIDPT